MRILLFFITLLSAQAAEPVRVFLFAGQSNMEGADTDPKLVETFPPFKDALEALDNIHYSYQTGANHKSNGWTDLKVVGNNFGPEITFARAFRRQSKAPLAIIKDAWGGTTLVNDWDPDGGDEKSKKLYHRFITQVRDRLADLKKQGLTYKIEGLMWHQGENDMFHREGKQLYEKNLRNFIANVRKDLSVPELKVFVGEISTKGVWGMDNRANVTLIRNAQMAVVDSDPKIFFVPTSHLSFKVGRPFGLHYHFGTLGQLQHGEAYAKASLARTGAVTREIRLPKTKKVKLIILGGQRNMEGEEAWLAEIKDTPLAKPQKALFQYNLGKVTTSDGWQHLAPINHLDDFGPELSFGQKLIPHMKSDEVLAIYKFTDSGSQSLDWLPEGSKETYRNRYQDWITGIKKCRDDLVKQGYQCEISAVIWHCGENDRALNWMADKYATRFKTFMNATRKDLERPHLTWILTEQPTLPDSITGDKKLYDLNADLEELDASDPNLKFIKTSDLPHKPVLFGTEGIIALGQRMAEAWARTQSK
ncbi:MAG: sialate O-acetylesterase [Akkermansiaceae bacterium]